MSMSWKDGTLCPVCTKVVRYTGGRRKCHGCSRWFHADCGVDTRTQDQGYGPFCLLCLRESPRYALRRIAATMAGGRSPALEVILWSTMFNQDEEEISSKLRIPPATLREWGDRLRESGVWKEDGTVDLDVPEGSGFDGVSTMMVVASLVATGQIVRSRSGGPAPAIVPGEGEEQDGKQETC